MLIIREAKSVHHPRSERREEKVDVCGLIVKCGWMIVCEKVPGTNFENLK